MMLDHVSHKIVPANSGEGWRQFDVFMEAGDGKVLQFAWIVEIVTEGRYKDCWMTVAVSAPRPAGQQAEAQIPQRSSNNPCTALR